MTHTYTEQQLREAVAFSISYRQVLIRLGLKEAGGNYATLKKNILRNNLDTSHFKGRGWNKNNFGSRRNLKEYLTKYSSISSHKLRLRLLSEGIKSHQCEDCLLKIWNNIPIPLELHHINGIRDDNRQNNLKLLCPNCHALTDNYRSKNKSKA